MKTRQPKENAKITRREKANQMQKSKNQLP